jgi:hypothetical protein
MSRVGRTVLGGAYVLAWVLASYAGTKHRVAQGETQALPGGGGQEWLAAALLAVSLVSGALIGRRWALTLPFVALPIGLVIALSLADGHALVDLVLGLPLIAVFYAAAIGLGIGLRRFARRFAKPS